MGSDDEGGQGQSEKTTLPPPTFDAEPAGQNNGEDGRQEKTTPSAHHRDGMGKEYTSAENAAGDHDDNEGGLSAASPTTRQKRPFGKLSPQPPSPVGDEVVLPTEPEDMEILERDQGKAEEYGASSRVPDIRGEMASEGAGAAGDTVAAQGTSEDWEGEGDLAAIEIPNQSTMNRNQWKRFKKKIARKQGRQ